ncbi:LOW QUALITY PROTEIN: uncharacterized protein LOC122787916 [Protopterus annectens]|uniref:LOW QUALITY PROTEIN: uncharacterized protein LOC122787916 n=1 Tax=Protopterus annectens TaxID=7888 RepID=UPI001CF950FF|nr:LOW QUALITY PROTEIN: uncharacterized protein LOC122787916 [Protopterus annectens]
MREQAKLFIEFAGANQTAQNTTFIVAAVNNREHTGASIYLYEQGIIISDHFETPSQPDVAILYSATYSTLTIKMGMPNYGANNVLHYRVEYCIPEKQNWVPIGPPSEIQLVTISGLLPNTHYRFKCTAVCKAGISKASNMSSIMKTLPCFPPELSLYQKELSAVTIVWVRPSVVGEEVSISHYITEYKEFTSQQTPEECADTWVQKQTHEDETRCALEALKPDTSYIISVFASCGTSGKSDTSEKLTVSTLSEACGKRPIENILKDSKLIEKGTLSVYAVPLNKTFYKANGADKTTLIIGMVNYILGVAWNDDCRFRIIEESTSTSVSESQTSVVTAYEINHQDGFQVPYTLTIIDTPGFGDTRGISRDREIMEQISVFFSNPWGIDQIDAVCFVTQASLARLTHTQKYGQRPPVLEAIKNSKNQMKKIVMTNMIILTSCSGRWEEQHEYIFAALFKMETRSLFLTKEVLKQRKQLETAIEGIQLQVQAGLAKLDEIRKTKNILEQHEADRDANKHFVYEVEITVPVQKPITGTGYITNCQKCHYTCHYPCAIPNDDGKHGCAAMGSNGYCTACPGKCYWSVHFNQTYRWEYVQKKVQKTTDELKQKYEKAHGAKLSTQQIIDKLLDEFAGVGSIVLELIEVSSECVSRLEEIALKGNPLSMPQYIDLLIEAEKTEKKPGYMDRIESLKTVREQAVLIDKIAHKEQLLPEQWKQYQAQTQRAKGWKDKAKETLLNFWKWLVEYPINFKSDTTRILRTKIHIGGTTGD